MRRRGKSPKCSSNARAKTRGQRNVSPGSAPESGNRGGAHLESPAQPVSLLEPEIARLDETEHASGQLAVHTVDELLGSIIEFAAEFDDDGTFINLRVSNDALLFRPLEEMLGRRARDIFPQETTGPFEGVFRQVLATGEPDELKFPIELSDGRHWFIARVVPVFRRDGPPKTVRVLGHDITKREVALEQLRKTQALLASAEQLGYAGSWEYEVDGHYFEWSNQFFRRLGLEPERGRVTLERACQSIHAEDRERVWADVRILVSEGQPVENEVRFLQADGAIRHFHTRAIPVVNPGGRVARILGISQDITERKHAEEELRRLSRQLLQMRDEERRRIARELHETAAQSVVALKMTLARLAEALPHKDERGEALLKSSSDLADEAIRKVRTVSYLLHPPMLDEAGLEPAVRWYASGFSERSGIEVNVDVAKSFGRLPPETEIALFRIVQEALTNVHRHSGSRTAVIRLARINGKVRLEVEDRGRGMALPSAATGWHSPLGVGIAGTRERVKQLEGDFEIQSAPGHGTTIRVVLPVARERADTSASESRAER